MLKGSSTLLVLLGLFVPLSLCQSKDTFYWSDGSWKSDNAYNPREATYTWTLHGGDVASYCGHLATLFIANCLPSRIARSRAEYSGMVDDDECQVEILYRLEDDLLVAVMIEPDCISKTLGCLEPGRKMMRNIVWWVSASILAHLLILLAGNG